MGRDSSRLASTRVRVMLDSLLSIGSASLLVASVVELLVTFSSDTHNNRQEKNNRYSIGFIAVMSTVQH